MATGPLACVGRRLVKKTCRQLRTYVSAASTTGWKVGARGVASRGYCSKRSKRSDTVRRRCRMLECAGTSAG